MSGKREADAEQSVSRIGARLADSSLIRTYEVLYVPPARDQSCDIDRNSDTDQANRDSIISNSSRFYVSISLCFSFPMLRRRQIKAGSNNGPALLTDLTLQSVIFRMHVYDARPSRVRHVRLARRAALN